MEAISFSLTHLKLHLKRNIFLTRRSKKEWWKRSASKADELTTKKRDLATDRLQLIRNRHPPSHSLCFSPPSLFILRPPSAVHHHYRIVASLQYQVVSAVPLPFNCPSSLTPFPLFTPPLPCILLGYDPLQEKTVYFSRLRASSLTDRYIEVCIMQHFEPSSLLWGKEQKYTGDSKDNLQRNKRSLKTTRFYEDEVIKLKTLKTRRMVSDSFIRYLCRTP
ncbi:hypothetical protein M9H77_08474 [Catharanthus roseus]|uniref:Uncharacterized protein n=1 Tax=Catharanthus roseus TaxID=4058 RepID=A0ACC0BXX0_CATRO|nr:hypothetical protein M9H77_08474 [Catharanthus roseus]